MTDLADVYRRELLSFLQYVRQAPPYAAAADRPTVVKLQQMADEERAALKALGEYLDRARVTLPHVGAFPTAFTNYNFVALRKVLQILREDQAKGLAQLEQDVAGLPEGPDRAEVEKLVALKRRHLTELEALTPAS
jgi:hypothetical protein